MLVLSRKKNEVIRVGDEIKITVLEIRGEKVRIGIDAPTNVGIHREEVWQVIQANQQSDLEIDIDRIPQL